MYWLKQNFRMGNDRSFYLHLLIITVQYSAALYTVLQSLLLLLYYIEPLLGKRSLMAKRMSSYLFLFSFSLRIVYCIFRERIHFHTLYLWKLLFPVIYCTRNRKSFVLLVFVVLVVLLLVSYKIICWCAVLLRITIICCLLLLDAYEIFS